MARQLALATLIGLALVAAFAVPTRLRQVDRQRSATCFSNVKLIGMAMLAYAADYDERLPVATAYPAAVMDQPVRLRAEMEGLHLDRRLWICPADARHETPGYAYCRAWAGAKLDDIVTRSESVLLYDASGGQPAYRHAHEAGGNRGPSLTVAYCDGRAEQDTAAFFTVENARTGRGPDYSHYYPALPPGAGGPRRPGDGEYHPYLPPRSGGR